MSLSYGFCLGELGTKHDSEQFSSAFHALVGDGITDFGSRFSLTVNGFTATAASGYAYIAGRWLKNEEPIAIVLRPSGNNEDRVDALVVEVDYTERKAALRVISDVEPSELPHALRTDNSYSIVLDLIRVPRGATSLVPEYVTDTREDKALCGVISPLSSMSADVLYIYEFLTSGIDEELNQLINLSNHYIQRANVEIEKLDNQILKLGGKAQIGELMTSITAPSPPDEWLLCDGTAVPELYPDLVEMLNGSLPNIPAIDQRFKTYIYGGRPEGGSD